jgi:hypothetical protein
MTRTREVDGDLRRAWMASDASLLEVIVAERRLARSPLLAGECTPEQARTLLASLSAWPRRIGRCAESIGLPLVLLATTTWLGPGAPKHPESLGLGALATIVVAWLASEGVQRWKAFNARSNLRFFAAVLIAVWGALFAIAIPGRAVDVPFPRVWLAFLVAVAPGCAYLYRLVRLAPDPSYGVPTLAGMWRAGGTRESTVQAMAAELDDLAATRREAGRPLAPSEWMDEGLIVDWPDEADRRRALRAASFALLRAALFAGILVTASAVSSPEHRGVLDGRVLSLAASLFSLQMLQRAIFVRRGRWLMLATIPLAHLTFLIPGDQVIAEFALIGGASATLALVALMWRRGAFEWVRRRGVAEATALQRTRPVAVRSKPPMT